MAEVTNVRVLAVDYRLAPRFKFPTALEDCYSTLQWASAELDTGESIQIEYILWGDSAEGTFVLVFLDYPETEKGLK